MRSNQACFPVGSSALNLPASVVQAQHKASLLQPASACQKRFKSEHLFCRCTGNSCFSLIVTAAFVRMADLHKDVHYSPKHHELQFHIWDIFVQLGVSYVQLKNQTVKVLYRFTEYIQNTRYTCRI